MNQHTILIATSDTQRLDELATQLSADGHTVHTASDAATAAAKLATHATGAVILGDLDNQAAAVHLLRALRAGAIQRHVDAHQTVITLGATDTVSTLRAYEAGSDHHAPAEVDVLVLRAILAGVTRRATGAAHTPREIRVGELTIDTATRTVDVAGHAVRLTRIQFDLLAQLASDPHRVMTRDELMRTVWGHPDTGRSRTLDAHAARLRNKLANAGADDLIVAHSGVGYHLLPHADR